MPSHTAVILNKNWKCSTILHDIIKYQISWKSIQQFPSCFMSKCTDGQSVLKGFWSIQKGTWISRKMAKINHQCITGSVVYLDSSPYIKLHLIRTYNAMSSIHCNNITELASKPNLYPRCSTSLHRDNSALFSVSSTSDISRTSQVSSAIFRVEDMAPRNVNVSSYRRKIRTTLHSFTALM